MYDYDTGAIHELLCNAFEPADLYRLCRDTQSLQPICQRVNREAPIVQMADKVIEFCRQQLCFEELLRAVCAVRRRWFEQLAHRLGGNAPDLLRGYTQAERDAYLDFVIRQCEKLDLRLMRRGGEPVLLPLQEVYVALRADQMNPAERAANRALLDLEAREMGRRLGLLDLTPDQERQLRYQVLVGHPLMLALLGRDRERLFDPALRDDRLDLAEAFCRYRWLVILGDPGSGKTTLLRWLALQLATALRQGQERVIVPARHVSPTADPEATADLGPARLPLLVRVADLVEARTRPGGDPYLPLADFLGPHPVQNERPPVRPEALRALAAEALAHGQAVLLLDGLDEITDPNQRLEVVTAIETFIRDHVRDPDGCSPLNGSRRSRVEEPARWPAQAGGNQILITSRIVGYHAAPLQGDLAHLTIEPMDDPTVDRFCANWSLALHRFLDREGRQPEEELRQQAARQAEALQAAVHANPSVRELAGNPLLLTLLAALYREEGPLPPQRVRLYQRAVETLVEVWRGVGLNEIEFTHALAPLAYWLHQNRPTGLALESEVRRQVTIGLARYHRLDPDDLPPDFEARLEHFLRQAREEAGLLLARGESLYGFLHLTFQEYFAARELTRRVRETADRLRQHLGNPRWREPLLLAVAWVSYTQGAEDLDELLTALLETPDPAGDLLPRNALFVAACIPELAQPPLGVVRRVATDLLAHYARTDEMDGDRPFAPLRHQIETAFSHLRRGDTARVVDELLAAALRADDPAHRTAAARLIATHGWASRTLAEALLDAHPADRSVASWVSRALQRLLESDPSALPDGRLPFRRALRQEAGLADRLVASDDWVRLAWTVYGDHRPDRIAWDSPLTPLLLPRLRARPAPAAGQDPACPDEELRQALLATLEAGGPAHADAALALAALGEGERLVARLTEQGRDPARRAEVEAAVLALARARDRARALALDLDRARDLDLARDLDRARARDLALALDRDLALALDRDLDRILDMIEGGADREPQQTMNTLRAGPPLPLTPELLARLSRWLGGDDPFLRRAASALFPHFVAQTGLFREETDSAGGELLSLWPDSGDPLLSTYAALLQAELGRLPPSALPHLAGLLAGPHDLLRYRAALALNRPPSASALGAAGLEALADLAERWEEQPEVGTWFDWALKEVEQDDPALLARYLQGEGKGAILGRIHRLAEPLWPAFLQALRTGPAGAAADQRPLLDSTSWLLRLGRVPARVQPDLTAALLTLAGQEQKVRQAALVALGHLPSPTPAAVATLQAALTGGPVACRAAAAHSLGRLLSRSEEDGAGQTALEAALQDPEEEVRSAAAAALARIALHRHGAEVDAALERLTPFLPDPTFRLHALLQAGSDDDVWDAGAGSDGPGYHTRVVRAVRALVGRQPELLSELVSALEKALAADTWPPRRIALAALAACAEEMPALFDHHAGRSPAELEALLVRGAREPGSFTARRSALTALGHLRRVTPAVAQALQAGLRDVGRVQEDAIQAVERFRQIEGDPAALLPDLAQLLEGESAAAAYGAARLLAALGRSATIEEATRQAIHTLLVQTLRRELAREFPRQVFLLEGEEIEYKGALAEFLFEALARLSG